MRPTSRLPLLALLAVSAACATDRRLFIETTPPGALVRLDEEPVGETPLELEFLHYGTRRLALELDGHLRVERDLVVEPPWYLRFPLDIVTEVLLPFGWEDYRDVHVELVAVPDSIAEDEYAVVRARAETFRQAGDTPPEELPSLGEAAAPIVTEPR